MTTLQTTHHRERIHPQGKNSRFRAQSGIVKHSFSVFGLSNNLSSPMYRNAVRPPIGNEVTKW